MTKYSYTLVVEDIEKSVAFLPAVFQLECRQKRERVCVDKHKISTCIQYGEKTYLYMPVLEFQKKNYREQSFCTWLYGSEEELLAEKAELLRKGLVQIGALGHFLRDENGRIWELRKRRRFNLMGKHTAHGYLVEDVYKEAEKNSQNCLVLNQRGLMRHLPDFDGRKGGVFSVAVETSRG